MVGQSAALYRWMARIDSPAATTKTIINCESASERAPPAGSSNTLIWRLKTPSRGVPIGADRDSHPFSVHRMAFSAGWYWASLRPAARHTLFASTPKPVSSATMIATHAATLVSPHAELVVEVRSDACLQHRIDRGDQIAELVDDTRESAARLRGRKLIEMGRNDAPRALDNEPYQKSPNRQRRSPHRASSNGWSRELCKRAQFCHYE